MQCKLSELVYVMYKQNALCILANKYLFNYMFLKNK